MMVVILALKLELRIGHAFWGDTVRPKKELHNHTEVWSEMVNLASWGGRVR